jgi:hypothetical protein
MKKRVMVEGRACHVGRMKDPLESGLQEMTLRM